MGFRWRYQMNEELESDKYPINPEWANLEENTFWRDYWSVLFAQSTDYKCIEVGPPPKPLEEQ